MADNRGTYHITDNNDIYEPARNNNFEFLIPTFASDAKQGIGPLLKAGTDANAIREDDYVKNPQEVVRVAVEASSVPQFQLSKIEIKRGNNTAKFAGVPTFNDGQLILKDYISIDSGYSNPKDIIMAWQALAYDVRTEKVHRAKNYKRTCMLYEYSPDWDVVRAWVIEGCWISEISEDNFSSESEGKRTFTATVVYDKAYPTRNFSPVQA